MKKQPPVLQSKKKEAEINKKAIVWVSSLVGAIIVLMTVLLIVNG